MLAVIATLLTLSVAGQLAKYVFGHDEVFGLVRLTFVTAEGNLPTFYSAVALLACAVLLWGCGQVARAEGGREARQWSALSLIFLYLAVDEASRIHELTGQAMKRVIAFDGFLYYPWVLLGSTAVLIAAVSFFSFVRSLPVPTRRLVVIAGAVFVGGAIGIEMPWGASCVRPRRAEPDQCADLHRRGGVRDARHRALHVRDVRADEASRILRRSVRGPLRRGWSAGTRRRLRSLDCVHAVPPTRVRDAAI